MLFRSADGEDDYSDGVVTTSEAVTITVTEVNQAPVINAITDRITKMGTAVTLTVTATDADLPAQTLTYSLASGAPVGATIHATTGAFSWTPTESVGNSPGQFPITILVSDGQLTALRTFTVTVNQSTTVAPYIINGTNGNDLITITEGPLNALSVTINGTTTNVTLAAGRELHVYALNGHDIVNLIGLTRPTFVDGGNGHDLIQGLLVTNIAATLWLNGGAGLDLLRGGAGLDHLDGGEDTDFLSGGAGNDMLRGGAGIDVLSGDAGNDTLFGGTDDDFLYGSAGNDTLWGEAGNDILVGGTGDDILDGGIGHDTVYAGDGNDTLRGGAGNDLLLGQAGNDTLQGDAGNDQIAGGGGLDTIHGGAGTDQGVTPAAGSPPMVSIETVLTTETALLAAATAAKQAWLTNFLTVIDADPADFIDRNEISILINTAS